LTYANVSCHSFVFNIYFSHFLLQDDKKEKANLTSSKAFFSQLQEEVTSHVKSRTAEKRKQKTDKAVNIKKFKL